MAELNIHSLSIGLPPVVPTTRPVDALRISASTIDIFERQTKRFDETAKPKNRAYLEKIYRNLVSSHKDDYNTYTAETKRELTYQVISVLRHYAGTFYGGEWPTCLALDNEVLKIIFSKDWTEVLRCLRTHDSLEAWKGGVTSAPQFPTLTPEDELRFTALPPKERLMVCSTLRWALHCYQNAALKQTQNIFIPIYKFILTLLVSLPDDFKELAKSERFELIYNSLHICLRLEGKGELEIETAYFDLLKDPDFSALFQARIYHLMSCFTTNPVKQLQFSTTATLLRKAEFERKLAAKEKFSFGEMNTFCGNAKVLSADPQFKEWVNTIFPLAMNFIKENEVNDPSPNYAYWQSNYGCYLWQNGEKQKGEDLLRIVKEKCNDPNNKEVLSDLKESLDLFIASNKIQLGIPATAQKV